MTLRCLCSSSCTQVPVAFGPSKHRSTQIDTGHRVLQGTSDTPAALASLPCAKAKFPAGSSSKLAAAGARSGSADRPAHHKTTAATNPRGASASAAVSEPASCTLYQTDFSAGSGSSSSGSLKVLTHSPARLAAARRTLESSSEWAELDKLEVLRTQQEVRVCCVLACCFCLCCALLGGCMPLSVSTWPSSCCVHLQH